MSWICHRSFQIFSLSNYAYMYIHINAVYPSYCGITMNLYMQAYELIKSV